MYTDSQRLGFKISPIDHRYHKQLHQNLAESQDSFSGVQTPGWSSLMRSEISDRTKRNLPTDRDSEGLKQSDILNKLKKLDSKPLNMQSEIGSSKQRKVDKNETLDTYKSRGRANSRERNQPQNLTHQNSKHNQSTGKLPNKRWAQITVHEHLYLNSKKLENKKMIEKILDEEYKKKQVFPFQPTINPKSSRLAETKYSRMQIEFKDRDSAHQETTAEDTKEKECKDVERYRILNRTFYFLSGGDTLLSEQNISRTLQELPMPAISSIQPIIECLYQGNKLQWVDFVQQFNSSKIKKREVFFSLMGKWFQRRDSIAGK